MASFSDSIIEEFRANGGQVTRPYPDSTLVLVTLRGARSGREMTLPIEYLLDDGRLVVFGTKSGAPENPAWVYNLRANPDVTVEYGSERFPAVAHEITGDERDRLWAKLVSDKPRFSEYSDKTDRKFPAFELARS